MTDLYKTIQCNSEGTYRDKGSKFLAFAYRVGSEESVKQHLESLRKQYHDASHHCYAWRLDPDKKQFRYNDDGEPSGTAGKPIYGQILSRDLTELLVVVVRYFGGTLLGVGGLIHAYRIAASDALDHTDIIECRVYDRLSLEFKYEQMNRVMKVIKDFQLEIEHQQFDMECSITLKIWKRQMPQVLASFSKITECKITVIEE
jgi:uncharacterized YigZ family protein